VNPLLLFWTGRTSFCCSRYLAVPSVFFSSKWDLLRVPCSLFSPYVPTFPLLSRPISRFVEPFSFLVVSRATSFSPFFFRLHVLLSFPAFSPQFKHLARPQPSSPGLFVPQLGSYDRLLSGYPKMMSTTEPDSAPPPLLRSGSDTFFVENREVFPLSLCDFVLLAFSLPADAICSQFSPILTPFSSIF